MNGLDIRGITKRYGDKNALEDISFQVKKGEIVSLLGPSGSGKTTLLEIIAGLQEPDQGDCFWDGKSLRDIPAYQRGFGLMFQEFALFPHQNVIQNVAFGLEMKDWKPADVKIRTAEVLNLVGLAGYEHREINTLSGGEQQRVALARSLAPEPKLLMLDEPLGSLDRTLRERLLSEIREILRKTNQTALYVTHDQGEAFSIADRLVILNQGRIAQQGMPDQIYLHPNSVFVARFLGLVNLLPGTGRTEGEESSVETTLGKWPVDKKISGPVTVLLRPEKVSLKAPDQDAQFPCLVCTLQEKIYEGQFIQLQVQCQGESLRFALSAADESLPESGGKIELFFDPHQALQILPPSGSSAAGN